MLVGAGVSLRGVALMKTGVPVELVGDGGKSFLLKEWYSSDSMVGGSSTWASAVIPTSAARCIADNASS